MDRSSLTRVDDTVWRIEPSGAMRVPGIIYASEDLISEMDEKVREQVANVATLPGIVTASYAMPDAHWGYGFPIGGVAAFDADAGGVVSAGGVGFDISCGVRTLLTGLPETDVRARAQDLAKALFETIPAGVGSKGRISLEPAAMDAMLEGGARWAVDQGWGLSEDLDRIEEHGCAAGARPDCVSEQAKKRQRREMGTLGSGNHYLEVQTIAEIFDAATAARWDLRASDVIVTIHCGSRGLGHQIGTDFLREMVVAAAEHGIILPDRELACVPIKSEIGARYLGAMRAGINCALANREIIGHLTRHVFAELLPSASMTLLYDVSHNTCKVEQHHVEGKQRSLFVHRKGATRALGPGHPNLPTAFAETGQPVLIGGSMGTCSYILVGTEAGLARSFGSACHGAGRAMSRHQARKRWRGRDVSEALEARGIFVRSPSARGVAEEAPGAYKDVTVVVAATEHTGLARRVARLDPMICIKG